MDFWRCIAWVFLASYIIVAVVSGSILYFIGKRLWKSHLKPTLQYFWAWFNYGLDLWWVCVKVEVIIAFVLVLIILRPDIIEMIVIATWASAVSYTLWLLILEPIDFHFSQWRARIFG